MNHHRKGRLKLEWHLTILIVALLQSLVSATDQWSSGTTDDSWKRISRLQSVGSRATVRSSFVVACIESSSPVERAAAVCWIARTASCAHILDLERRLTDQSAEIRSLAWNALLSMPDAKSTEIVLRAVESEAELPHVNPNTGGMGEEMQFPDVVCKLPLAERKQWIAGLGDRNAWIKSFVKERTSKETQRCDLKASIVEAQAGLSFTIQPKADAFRIYFSKKLRVGALQARAIASWQLNSQPVARKIQVDGESLQVMLSESDTIAPGIYEVRLTQQALFGKALNWRSSQQSCFSFYIRINRSLEQDQEIEQLLGRSLDIKVIERLGILRAQEAVPKLMDHFLAAKGIDQFATGTALAQIGDERAANVFLEVPCIFVEETLSTHDWIRELNPAARRVCGDKLIEISSHINEKWSQLDGADQQRNLNSMELALVFCDRPLSAKQLELGNKVISRLVDDARRSSGVKAGHPYTKVGSIVAAFLANDLEKTIAWLKANEDEPELVLGFLHGFLWRGHYEETEMEISRQCWKAVYYELTQWKSSAKLTEEQSSELENELAILRRDMGLPGR